MPRETSRGLPLELRQAVARASATVAAAPNQNLPPVYRRVIYSIMGYADPYSARGWLALHGAQRVADLWQAAGRKLLTGDPLGTVEALLRGRLSAFAGRQAAQAAWRQIVVAKPATGADPRALDAAQAVLQALREVLGADPFHAVSLRNTATDEDLDPAAGDTARFAAAAYSGRLDASASDAQRRGEFWQWWLHEAVPQAWNSGAASPGADTLARPKIW